MKHFLTYLIGIAIFALLGLGTAAAQTQSRRGTVLVPPTSVQRPQDLGRRAHTNFLIFVPAQKGSKPYLGGTSPGGETPSSLACVYQTGSAATPPSGCPVIYGSSSNMNYDNPSGGSNVIAIVDAYHYPTAYSDFDTFSNTFNLPVSTDSCNNSHPCFSVIYASGSQPKTNCGWAQEAALDIEWAHAMAPHAQIILVEAASNSNANLMQAVKVARDKVAALGGGEVSMSWGGGESSTQTTYDSYFTGTNVTYFASSGDSGGKVSWPSSSPDVVSAGGTSVNRDSNGNFTDETVWSSAGGGPSKIEPVPTYQSSIYSLAQLLNGYRGTPDISFDADPYTGVSVYDSTFCQGLSGWLVFGGTSVSSPSLAGIVNLSGNFSGNNGVQSSLYQNYSSVSNGGESSKPYTDDFFDVTNGSAGNYAATSDWDFASGIGTVRGLSGLAAGSTGTPSFSVSANPTSASVTQGQGTNSTITVSSVNGYTGTVDLSYSCPTGVSCGLGSTTVSFASSTSPQKVTLTIGTSPTTTASTYTLTVTGADSSDPTMTSSATVSLTVTSAGSGGGFSLNPSNSSIIVSAGSSVSDVINIVASGGFSGSVTLSVSNLPKFTNGSFSPNPVSVTTSGGSSTLTIKANKHISPTQSPQTLTITGTDSSGATASATVQLTVQ